MHDHGGNDNHSGNADEAGYGDDYVDDVDHHDAQIDGDDMLTILL